MTFFMAYCIKNIYSNVLTMINRLLKEARSTIKEGTKTNKDIDFTQMR